MDYQQFILNKRMVEVNRRMDCVNHRVHNYMSTTDYVFDKMNGQRITCAPGTATKDSPKGCEVFVGKIPRDMFEDELLPIFEQIGPVYKFRLMVDFSGINRGYGFVTYFTKENATAAVTMLHGFEVRRGKNIGVYKSVDNCRLFVGGIPADKTRRDVKEALEEFVTGIRDVIMYSSHEDKKKNRGFAFVEFEDHRLAAMARRKLAPGALILWEVPMLVDWADPLPEVDVSVMGKVTKLYIRNLDIDMTNEALYKVVSGLVNPDSIVKTHKILDYAFVHLTSRKEAEEALKILEGLKINGVPIEVSWARPRMYSKKYQQGFVAEHYCTSLPPRVRKQMQQDTHVPPPLPTYSRSFSSASPSPPKPEPPLFRNMPSTSSAIVAPSPFQENFNHFDQNNFNFRMPRSMDLRCPTPTPNYFPTNRQFYGMPSQFNSLSLS